MHNILEQTQGQPRFLSMAKKPIKSTFMIMKVLKSCEPPRCALTYPGTSPVFPENLRLFRKMPDSPGIPDFSGKSRTFRKIPVFLRNPGFEENLGFFREIMDFL